MLLLAQCNVAWRRFELDHPQMRDFVENVSHINALGDSSPGFVWRYVPTGASDATGQVVFGDPTCVYNCTVWRSVEDLYRFTFRSEHKAFVARAREWFEPPRFEQHVMWWTSEWPAVEESERRLQMLWSHGPMAAAFTFRDAYHKLGTPMPIGWRRKALRP